MRSTSTDNNPVGSIELTSEKAFSKAIDIWEEHSPAPVVGAVEWLCDVVRD